MRKFEYYESGLNYIYFLKNSPEYASGEFFCSFTDPSGSVWNFARCDICGGFYLKVDLEETKVEGEVVLVCRHCWENDEILWCSGCNQYVYGEHIAMDDGDIAICRDCAPDYAYCFSCGRIIRVREAYECGGATYCKDCWERRLERAIHSYHFKPNPIFHGNGEMFLGVELEVDKGGESEETAAEILDQFSCSETLFYIKHDGSLYDGFEIVTHPATLDFHLQRFPWEELCHELVSRGYRSHDTSTCGLHVHVNRSYLGENESKQDLTIMKILFLVERMLWPYVVLFSRRDEDEILEWARRYDIHNKEQAEKIVEESKEWDHDERYYAVNLTNKHTIEFRIFKGTLKVNTIYATLQFVSHLVNYCLKNDIETIRRTTWEGFVSYCRRQRHHKELFTYLEERGLLS